MDFNEEETKFEWRKYLDMAWRYKWLIMVPAIVSTVAATAVAYSLPKVYRASTIILVENKQLLTPLVEGLAVSTSVSARLRALNEEILSFPRLTQLVEKLGLDEDVKSPAQFENLIRALKSKIKVLMRNENFITIHYEDSEPLNAQNVVRTISDILIERNVQSQSAEADDAISFLERELDEYRTKMEKSEDELRKFKEVYNNTLPVAARVNEQIIDLEMKINMLLVENTEAHPAVIEARKKLVQLKSEREKELDRTRTQGIDVDSDDYKAISYSVPRQEQELARLQRDTQVNAKLYHDLLSRLESAKISKKLDNEEEGARFKVIEPARLPLTPIKPKKERIILLGLAMGVGLGCGIAFLLEMANGSFRSVEEAKEALPLPILGTISTIRVEEDYIKEMLKKKPVKRGTSSQ